MPAQFVFEPQRDQNADLDQLMTGLVQNVAYRRAQQARKFATAQDMSAKMAAGLIPKADISITDEGYEFKDEGNLGSTFAGTGLTHGKQRKAFYEAIGGMMDNEDLDQTGGTNGTAEMIDDEAEYANEIKRATNEANNAPGLEESLDNFRTHSNNTFGQNGPSPQPGPSPGQNAMANILGLTSPQVTPAAPGAIVPTPLLNAGQPAPPTTGPSIASTFTGTGNRVSSTVKEQTLDSIDTEVSRPEIAVNRDKLGAFSTTRVSERIDPIKTSYMNLMGLSALENYDNQLMKTNDMNVNAPVNETFQNIAKQRLADIARWELAATGDGTVQDIKKVGDRSYKVGASTQKLKTVKSGALSATNSVGNTTNKPSGTAVPERTFDGISGGLSSFGVKNGRTAEPIGGLPWNLNTAGVKTGADLYQYAYNSVNTGTLRGQFDVIGRDEQGNEVPMGTSPAEIEFREKKTGKRLIMSYLANQGGYTPNKTGYQGWGGTADEGFPIQPMQQVLALSFK